MGKLRDELNQQARLRPAARRAILALHYSWPSWRRMGAGDTDARFNRLGHQLMCMCGCNQVLLECNHVGCPYSDRMRHELMAAIQRGDSDNLVLQSFVQKYGNTVLAAPTTTGFNRIAWIMPFVIFTLGHGRCRGSGACLEVAPGAGGGARQRHTRAVRRLPRTRPQGDGILISAMFLQTAAHAPERMTPPSR